MARIETRCSQKLKNMLVELCELECRTLTQEIEFLIKKRFYHFKQLDDIDFVNDEVGLISDDVINLCRHRGDKVE